MTMPSPPVPVYSKSNPAAGGASMSPRQKRALIITSIIILLAAVAGAIYGAVSSDPAGTSAKGCISVNIAGSIGGELIHECGAAAQTACRNAYAGSDAVSLAIRPACEQAGLTKAKVGG